MLVGEMGSLNRPPEPPKKINLIPGIKNHTVPASSAKEDVGIAKEHEATSLLAGCSSGVPTGISGTKKKKRNRNGKKGTSSTDQQDRVEEVASSSSHNDIGAKVNMSEGTEKEEAEPQKFGPPYGTKKESSALSDNGEIMEAGARRRNESKDSTSSGVGASGDTAQALPPELLEPSLVNKPSHKKKSSGLEKFGKCWIC